MNSRLYSALTQNEFKMYLQPKVSLTTQKIVGAEALARWQISNQMLLPGFFLHLFEKADLTFSLDLFIFRKACNFINSLLNIGIILPISVNFSKFDCFGCDFPVYIKKIADEYSVPYHLLEIEITEYHLLNESSLDALHKVKEMGFHVSIDDFGTGYSSLELLKNITVNTIKLDRQFLVHTVSPERNEVILDYTIQMAKALNVNVVAEGIETAQQEPLLNQLQCDMGQGYYYSQPVPKHDFFALLLHQVRHS